MNVLSKERIREILNEFSNLSPLLVFGDVGVDKYNFGEVKRISPEAPVPVLKVMKESYKLGLAANVSDNLKAFRVSSTLAGIIGDDDRGTLFESLLEEKELSTWGIVRAKQRMTTQKERITTATQQICRVDFEEDVPIPHECEVKFMGRFEDFVQDHSAVIIEDYAKGLVTQTLCSKLISLFKEANKLVAVDPSRYAPPHFYKGATLLKPNRDEAIAMAQALGHGRETDLNMIAEILVDKLELEKLVITLGKNGMALIDTKGDGLLHVIPTVATDVFDVSGAGDTAISAICSSLASGASLMEACWIGNCASGVVVGKKGTATVSLDELQKFHENLLDKL